MPITQDQLRTCRCGRLLDKPHCPECGGYVINALVRDETTTRLDTGELARVRTYRCRRCSNKFNDFHRQVCQAPPPLRGILTAQKQEAERLELEPILDSINPEYEGLSYDERLKKVKEKLSGK